MAEIYLPVPDKRTGIIQRITTPVYPGNEVLEIKSGMLLGIPQYFTVTRFYMKLITDATVGNRYIKLKEHTRHDDAIGGMISAAVAASSSLEVQGGAFTAYNYYTEPGAFGLFDEAFLVFGDDKLKASITGGFAGDVWNAIFEFKYMNRLWGMVEVLPDPPDPRGSAPVPKPASEPKGGK